MLLNHSQSAPPNVQQLPNLIIIGAMKCGTTSLHQYLNLHPQIQMSGFKELDFFVKEKNWQRGLNWYQCQFAEPTDIIGESSPNYTKYPVFSGVPERMHQMIPGAKLIYLVRDPIRRILSHYLHQYTNRAEQGSLQAALTDLNQNNYVTTSCYAMQLEQFLPYYSMDQILVLSLEELSQNRRSTLQRVFRFLAVDPNFDHPAFSQVFHQSSDKQRLTNLGAMLFRLPAGGRLLNVIPHLMAEDVTAPRLEDSLRQQLAEVLQPDVERLRSLTGESFSAWSL
jgi:Sulfotransferase domain